MNKAAQAYFQTNVNTTDQGQLLLLLYDGALRFLQQAREKMLENDYAAKGILISKVIDIINELTNTLNLEKGGSLAENLNNLYFLCITRLLQANLKMDVNQLDNVVSILSGLRSAYAEIIETPEARRVSAQIAAKLNVDASVGQRGAVQRQVSTMPTAMGKMQARNAYGSMQRGAGVPVATPAAPTAPMAQPIMPTPVRAAEIAFTAPVSEPVAAPTTAPQPPAPAQTSAPQATASAPPVTPPPAPQAPAPTMPPVQNDVAPPVASAPVTPTANSATPETPTAPSTATRPAAGGFGVKKGFGYTKAFGK